MAASWVGRAQSSPSQDSPITVLHAAADLPPQVERRSNAKLFQHDAPADNVKCYEVNIRIEKVVSSHTDMSMT